MEVRGNNRSVMPLDVLGRTRATLIKAMSNVVGQLRGQTFGGSRFPSPEGAGNLVKLDRDGDRSL